MATKEAVIEGGEGRVGGWSTEGKGIRGGGGCIYMSAFFISIIIVRLLIFL